LNFLTDEAGKVATMILSWLTVYLAGQKQEVLIGISHHTLAWTAQEVGP